MCGQFESNSGSVRPRETSVRAAVQRSRGSAGSWDPDTNIQRVKRVLTMVDYGAAPMAQNRMSGKTIQVVTP